MGEAFSVEWMLIVSLLLRLPIIIIAAAMITIIITSITILIQLGVTKRLVLRINRGIAMKAQETLPMVSPFAR